MNAITLKSLAKALLHCSADATGRRSMENLLLCLGVDSSDRERAEWAKEEIHRLCHNIDEHLGCEGTPGNGHRFERRNLYPTDSIKWHIYELMKNGSWVGSDMIYCGVRSYLSPDSVQASFEFNHSLLVVGDPWHKENGGRSFLRFTRDPLGNILYRLEFDVPEYAMNIGFQAFGRLPRAVDPPAPVVAQKDSREWRMGKAPANSPHERRHNAGG